MRQGKRAINPRQYLRNVWALRDQSPIARLLAPISTAVLATLMFILGFGGGYGRLSAPLGAGDLLPAYAAAKVWSLWTPFGNTVFGYPFGIEYRYYPTTDIFQNLSAGAIAAVTGNPFLGMNAVFAASFPLTALAALWVLRIAGARGPISVVMALAFTMIPYHWFRLDHVYLGTMYSAVLGVGLALMVGTGRVEWRLLSSRRRPALNRLRLAAIALVIAASGIYYAYFTVLLCATAVVYRACRGSSLRALASAMAPAIVVAVMTGLALAPSWLYQRANPALIPVADRHVVESVQYSGTLAFALMPVPISEVPGFDPVNKAVEGAYNAAMEYPTSGVLWYANFGSLLTVLALVFVLVGAVVVSRRRALRTEQPALEDHGTGARGNESSSLGLIAFLFCTALLFYIPWGLNFIFAYAVTGQLRGWDRLTPVLFLLLFAGAATVWRLLGMPNRGARVMSLGAVLTVLLVMDSVVPYRVHFAAATANGSTFSVAGYAYAAALNAAIPGRCGVLELPYVGYPEEPPSVDMGNYEPLWPALTNAEKDWSFGSMKGTAASAWQEELGSNVDAEAVESLRAGGFCAIHVDRRGYTSEDADYVIGNLTRLLGSPVATGYNENWVAFVLAPSDEVESIAFDDLAGAPDAIQLFYAPPIIVPDAGLAQNSESDAFREWWWLDSGRSEFEIRAIDDAADFAAVSGELLAAECGDQEVLVALSSGTDASSMTVQLAAGESRAFEVRLERPTIDAVLSISSLGEPCELEGDGRQLSAALLNPTAEY